MSQERMKVLEMIETGKISAAEGEKLLAAMDAQDDKVAVVTDGVPRSLRITIAGKDDPEPRINFGLPLAVAGLALKFIPKNIMEKLDAEGIDIQAIVADVKAGVSKGKIVEFDKGEDKITLSLE